MSHFETAAVAAAVVELVVVAVTFSSMCHPSKYDQDWGLISSSLVLITLLTKAPLSPISSQWW